MPKQPPDRPLPATGTSRIDFKQTSCDELIPGTLQRATVKSRGATDQVSAKSALGLVEPERESRERNREPHRFDAERRLLLEQPLKKWVPQ